MLSLYVAAAAFALTHLIIPGSPISRGLTARLGAGGYKGVFSLIAAGSLTWLIYEFLTLRGTAENQVFWGLTPATRHAQLALQFVAGFFILTGLMTGASPDGPRGVHRITRHPFLWGIALWAAGHILVNGDLASLGLFGSFLALGGLGPFVVDAKRRAAQGEAWLAGPGQTSSIPFAAILSGRQRLQLGEIGALRLGLPVVLYVALLLGHPYFAGVAALP